MKRKQGSKKKKSKVQKTKKNKTSVKTKEKELELYDLLDEVNENKEKSTICINEQIKKSPKEKTGKNLLGDICEYGVVHIQEVVDIIPLLKLPLLKIIQIMETSLEKKSDHKFEEILLSDSISKKLINSSLTKELFYSFREIISDHAKTSTDRNIKNGCLASLFYLDMHNANGLEVSQNPFWKALLQKSLKKIKNYWSVAKIVDELDIDKKENIKKKAGNLIYINSSYCKYIKHYALKETEKLFLSISRGGLDYLIEKLSLNSELMSLLYKQKQNVMFEMFRSEFFKFADWEYEEILLKNSKEEDLESITKVLDYFVFNENPIIFLIMLLKVKINNGNKNN